MAVYTPIAREALEAFLRGFDLGALVAFEGIAQGVENSNFKVETTLGRFILTLYERRVREADLPYFLDLMGWLGRRGFPCPAPQADRGGRTLHRLCGRPAALVSFLDGRSVERPEPRHCREAGAALARLHQAGEGFPGHRANDLGGAAWAGLFEGREAAAEALRPGLSHRIAEDLQALARDWPGELPAGVIHADLFPDNVFFQKGRFAAAIDFYFACNDGLAYDLAVCLNSWCFDPAGGYLPEHAHALVGGYERVRVLSAAEWAGLPVLARGAAMRFFLTRLADWNATPPGALVRPKDPMEYTARLDVFRSATAKSLGLPP